jgi:hypothetical protein
LGNLFLPDKGCGCGFIRENLCRKRATQIRDKKHAANPDSAGRWMQNSIPDCFMQTKTKELMRREPNEKIPEEKK